MKIRKNWRLRCLLLHAWDIGWSLKYFFENIALFAFRRGIWFYKRFWLHICNWLWISCRYSLWLWFLFALFKIGLFLLFSFLEIFKKVLDWFLSLLVWVLNTYWFCFAFFILFWIWYLHPSKEIILFRFLGPITHLIILKNIYSWRSWFLFVIILSHRSE